MLAEKVELTISIHPFQRNTFGVSTQNYKNTRKPPNHQPPLSECFQFPTSAIAKQLLQTQTASCQPAISLAERMFPISDLRDRVAISEVGNWKHERIGNMSDF